VSLIDSVKILFPFLRGPLRLPPELLRGLHPVRNPACRWSREGEERLAVIFMPRPPSQGLKMAVAKFIGEPPGKRIELSDELGTDVWELCDGDHTVRDICRELSKKYKLGDRQAEVAVLQFLNMLRSRRLVGIPTREQAQIDSETAKAKAGGAGAKSVGSDSHDNRGERPKPLRKKPARRH
jgi:hypothetical protein